MRLAQVSVPPPELLKLALTVILIMSFYSFFPLCVIGQTGIQCDCHIAPIHVLAKPELIQETEQDLLQNCAEDEMHYSCGAQGKPIRWEQEKKKNGYSLT